MPDARTTSDDLAKLISVEGKGANSALVQLSTASGGQGPYINSGILWIPLSVEQLPAGTSLHPGRTYLAAAFTDGSQKLEARLTLEIMGEIVLGAWVTGKKQADVRFDANPDQGSEGQAQGREGPGRRPRGPAASGGWGFPSVTCCCRRWGCWACWCAADAG